MNSSEIEHLLRHPPQPKTPPGLKQRIAAQAAGCIAKNAIQSQPVGNSGGGWFSRWWPALGPAAVSLACAALLTSQQIQIQALQKQVAAAAQKAQPASASANEAVAAPAASSASQAQELERLRELVARLSAEVTRLQQMQLENQKLRQQVAASSANALTPDEAKAVEEARARAMAIQCVNNMKQLGLAVKVWALDNGDMTPPDVLQMTNEMSTPKILACPADTAHPVATGGWASYSAANCSYEYLAPSTPDGSEPNRVLFRCPIHGSITLCDGSVQKGIAKTHPEWLVQKDGKIYFQSSGQ